MQSEVILTLLVAISAMMIGMIVAVLIFMATFEKKVLDRERKIFEQLSKLMRHKETQIKRD